MVVNSPLYKARYFIKYIIVSCIDQGILLSISLYHFINKVGINFKKKMLVENYNFHYVVFQKFEGKK